MNLFFSLLVSLVLSSAIQAQTAPLQWEAKATRTSDGHYTISLYGKLNTGWHLYVKTDPATGTEASSISWDNELVKTEGPLRLSKAAVPIKDPLFDGKTVDVRIGDFELIQEVSMKRVPATLKVKFNAFVADNSNFLPLEEEKIISLEGGIQQTADPGIKISSIRLQQPVASCGDAAPAASSGILRIFLLGFIGGLIALLTPCVFPMIPVTLSYFTSRSPSKKEGIRRGLLYGGFIWMIYILISLPFHLIDNVSPQLFNSISTNAWVNICFFAVFLYFSLSFFGLFDIRLPSFITNSSGAKSDIASNAGIFFMALTLVTVSFSCTGPILGSLLVGSFSATGGAWQLTAGLAGFGAALALPFGLFAMFPQLIRQLPRSGGWMETVKKSLAFIELALAFKFLSNADLVEHWGLLKREVFIGLWILISFAWALYLFGFFGKKPGRVIRMDGTREPIRFKPKMITGLLVLGFGIYLLPGLSANQNRPLSLLSGLAPPVSYSLYANKKHGAGFLEPVVVNDYKRALQLAKEQGKPLLIDFTGWACVNCRKMEELVWPEPAIQEMIRKNFILVSLYVDDRKKLPAEQQFSYQEKGMTPVDIRTIGEKWALFQAVNFSAASQPLYVILSPDEELLTHPVGFTPEAEDYRAWLQCGIDAGKAKIKLQAYR